MKQQMTMPVKLDQSAVQDFEQMLREVVYKLAEEMNKQNKSKPYMNKKETCEYIGISFNTLVKLQNAGLPIVMIDGIQMFRKVDIDEFFEKNRY